MARVTTPTALQRLARARELVDALGHADASLVVDAALGDFRALPEDELLRLWAAAANDAAPEATWQLYVHVPFCKSLCTFCVYRRLRAAARPKLERYVDSVLAQAESLSVPLSGVTFDAMYIGGGTPSVLDAPLLERLLTGLERAFHLRADAARHFELDPMVVSEDRFRVLAAHGFDRVSFGVQSLDRAVNERNGRGAQDRSHVARTADLIASHGILDSNMDLLAGLAGTAPEQVVAELDEVLAAKRVARVSVYFVAPTRPYVDAFFGGDFGAFEAHVERFVKEVPPIARELAERHGWTARIDGGQGMVLQQRVDGAATARRLDDLGRTHYCDVAANAHRPHHLVGLGDSARSHVFGQIAYETLLDEEIGGRPTYRGRTRPLGVESFAYVSHCFRDLGRVDRLLYRRTFGRSVEDAHPTAVDDLVGLGLAHWTEDALVLDVEDRRENLACAALFLPDVDAVAERVAGLSRPAGYERSSRADVVDAASLIAPLLVGRRLPGGYRLSDVQEDVLVVDGPNDVRLRVLVSRRKPERAWRRTPAHDVRYVVERGTPAVETYEPVLALLVGLIARNEAPPESAPGASPSSRTNGRAPPR